MNEPITPCLRADVLLRPFGQFEGDDRYIVAVDDRHFVVSPAVAAVLEESRAQSTLAALAARASLRLGMTVSTELASRVLSEAVLAVCFHATETRASSECPIRLRHALLSASVLKPFLALARPLFSRSSATAFVTLLILVEALVLSRAANASTQSLSGSQIVCAATLTALGIIVHEIGHLAACSRFGARHGGIGIGVYWCMPAFYAEVNGAWMLPRLQRAVVDIGGLYLQCWYVAALGAAYLLTGSPPILEAIAWTHFLMLHTLNPVLKYDGYWLLTDLAGIPNLHASIRDTARRVWTALINGIALPGARHVVLLAAFALFAAVYFSYVFVVLGQNIGRSLSASLQRWAAHDTTAVGIWQALGESALLALFLVMALSLSLLFARSLYRIGKDSSA
jgi:putative peptide zinc metalloprotease protein